MLDKIKQFEKLLKGIVLTEGEPLATEELLMALYNISILSVATTFEAFGSCDTATELLDIIYLPIKRIDRLC